MMALEDMTEMELDALERTAKSARSQKTFEEERSFREALMQIPRMAVSDLDRMVANINRIKEERAATERYAAARKDQEERALRIKKMAEEQEEIRRKEQEEEEARLAEIRKQPDFQKMLKDIWELDKALEKRVYTKVIKLAVEVKVPIVMNDNHYTDVMDVLDTNFGGFAPGFTASPILVIEDSEAELKVLSAEGVYSLEFVEEVIKDGGDQLDDNDFAKVIPIENLNRELKERLIAVQAVYDKYKDDIDVSDEYDTFANEMDKKEK